MTWIRGLDVSACQGRIRWDEVPARERYVFVKATEGAAYKDPLLEANLRGGRESGRLVGVYHFAVPHKGDARAQFRRLWESFGEVMPDLPLVLDLEARGALSGGEVIDWADEWQDECSTFTAVSPILYTGAYFLEACAPDPGARARLCESPLWLAQYSRGYHPWEPVEGVDAPRVPRPWSTWAFWQYTGNGGARVTGIDADVDHNVFKGSEEDLRALCGFPAPDPLADTLRLVPVVGDG